MYVNITNQQPHNPESSFEHKWASKKKTLFNCIECICSVLVFPLAWMWNIKKKKRSVEYLNTWRVYAQDGFGSVKKGHKNAQIWRVTRHFAASSADFKAFYCIKLELWIIVGGKIKEIYSHFVVFFFLLLVSHIESHFWYTKVEKTRWNRFTRDFISSNKFFSVASAYTCICMYWMKVCVQYEEKQINSSP